MREITAYFVVKTRIKINDDTSDDDILQRVASDCDYKIEHLDDICEVVSTELIDQSTWCPV